jgi:PleD family two-component response regulator
MNSEEYSSPQANEQSTSKPWYVIAAVADLMFTAKISSAAKLAGCAVKFLQQEERLLAALREVPAECTPLVIVDLNHLTLKPIEFIARLRTTPETSGVSVLAYLSHTQVDLKRAAEQAGCSLVLPRSIFSQNINEILRRQSCHLASL